MYTKSLFTSALLATSVAATNHEVWAAAAAPAPAVHTMAAPVAVAPPEHKMPAAPVAPAVEHKTMAPPAPPAAVHTPPAQQAHPVAAPPPAATKEVKGAMPEHKALNVHLVAVGDNNGSLKYFPDTVHAMPGDVVQFQFHPKNHTVTESSFDAPCVAKDASLATPQRPGLRSGFVPVTGQEDTTPVYNVLINDTMPIWIFCGQQPHCRNGMSMVINPPANNPERTIQKYQEAAAALPAPPAAGGAAPPASPPPAASGAASPPAAPASPPASAGGASPPAAGSSLGGGAIATPAAAGASTTDAAPATFTGGASKVGSSFSLGALLVGVVAML
ncbi:uncharacterized protein HMPREF1541_01048 [Cyphellophora europaea CBS 101466]|uniref:Phytocyanin domain-containing protein n=1 Tax=Cyphellophora europaea (strain CBS 101466) TaxID=1220924 RepID=W2SG56_CYPE1|nr:uncharacterized protein HMPREF1541_01048 [Cyphellophora europaea CBS 101466]ETN46859.1 hypothetical protein HMPREF1541_01048 [Cyphellophora europaea CBS 101466]